MFSVSHEACKDAFSPPRSAAVGVLIEERTDSVGNISSGGLQRPASLQGRVGPEPEPVSGRTGSLNAPALGGTVVCV